MILRGDARALPLATDGVHCVVTSPPYWGMRDSGVDGQIGLEESLEQYIAELVEVFREVRRVLRPDGTLWVNMGDRYVTAPSGPRSGHAVHRPLWHERVSCDAKPVPPLPIKSLVGLPWRLALALQADGWLLRSEIIWHKPNPMPETTYDRPTRDHEHLFLLTQRGRYHYDAAAIKERCTGNAHPRGDGTHPKTAAAGSGIRANESYQRAIAGKIELRNARTVWRIHPHQQHHGGHAATFPVELPRRCISAGCPAGGVTLDPFAGSGTTVRAAEELGRVGIGVELSADYCREAVERCAKPLQRDLLEVMP